MRWHVKRGCGLLVALGLLACSGSDDEEFSTECEPRAVRECSCPDDEKATQVCDEETAQWGECACPEPARPGEPGGTCETDVDCDDAAAPACVAGVCVAPVWVGPGESCNDPAARCTAGYFCNGRKCVVPPTDATD